MSYYRTCIRTEKRTVQKLNILSLNALVNSWILYRTYRKKLGDNANEIVQFFGFKLNIADTFFVFKFCR